MQAYTINHILASALRPLPSMTVSEWADAYRILPGDEAEPGPWRTSRFPPLRRIMDCLSPSHPAETVVFMKSAQVGGTEAGNNWIGCTIHLEPGRFLQIQPTTEAAKRHSKTRIAPLTKTPVLRNLIAPSRARDSGNTLFIKEYPGGALILTGANSAVGLSSTPIRYLNIDEVDKAPVDVDNQGDPLKIAFERTRTYRSKRKIYLCSTPNDAVTSRIEPAFEAGTKERYHVPCPLCGHKQPLLWAQVRWPQGEPEKAYYECIACLRHIHEGYKQEMLTEASPEDPDGAEWIPERECPGCIDGTHTGTPLLDTPLEERGTVEQAPGIAISFHLHAVYSPWITWAEMAREFLECKDDPVLLKDFVNLKLGETWKDKASIEVDATGLLQRCEQYDAEMPSGAVVITAGVDVQDDRIEVELAGWGPGEEFWSLAHEVLWGDPSSSALWTTLDDMLLSPLYDADDGAHYVQAAGIDTGGHHTLAAYAFCRPRTRRRVWALKGRAGVYPVWPKEPSRNNKGKVDLYLVGVDAAKEAIYRRLPHEPPGPGRMHFPMGYGQSYFDQLTAEHQRTKYVKGRPVREWWVKPNQRNEVIDTVVYAYAALQGLLMSGYHWQPLRRPVGGRHRETAQVAANEARGPGLVPHGARVLPPAPPSAQAAERRQASRKTYSSYLGRHGRGT